MLIPIANRSRRYDTFMNLDDFTMPPGDFELYLQCKESFTEYLHKYLICKNLDDTLVYTKACLSRKQWLTILGNKEYKLDKQTVIAIALALHLNMDETMELLHTAELELSSNHVFDLIIEYSITSELCDVSRSKRNSD